MTLRVAVQLDPIDTINIAGDSSFALMLAAQAGQPGVVAVVEDDTAAGANGAVGLGRACACF